MEMDISVYAVS